MADSGVVMISSMTCEAGRLAATCRFNQLERRSMRLTQACMQALWGCSESAPAAYAILHESTPRSNCYCRRTPVGMNGASRACIRLNDARPSFGSGRSPSSSS